MFVASAMTYQRNHHGSARWVYMFPTVAAVALLATVMLCATAQAESHRPQAPAWVKRFPLWMNVPTEAFAVLDEGIIGHRRWAVYTFRGTAAAAAQRPCIELAYLYYGPGPNAGSFSSSSQCGPLAPPSSNPLIAQSGLSTQEHIGGPVINSTVWGITFGRNVTRVRMTFQPKPASSYATRLLSRRQARKAHLQRFRYLAFGVRRSLCLDAIAGFDSSGLQLFESAFDSCD
jgi:hypothetical protein